MQIDVQFGNVAASEAAREYVQRRAHFSLSRLGERIRRVVVRLTDVNGQRGGVDKRCSVRVQLLRVPEVVVEDMDSDLYVAIDRTFARATRQVVRRIELVQRMQRKGVSHAQL